MDNEGGNWLITSDSERVVKGENFRFLCLCVGLLFRRVWSEVLIKYTGKYIKIYFIIKITFYLPEYLIHTCPPAPLACARK